MGAGSPLPSKKSLTSAVVLIAGLAAAPLLPSQHAGAKPASPAKTTVQATPIPTYQIEARTSTGIGPLATGGANLMRMMMGGAPVMGTTTSRSLELRLESPRVVPNPTAEHRIPVGLGLGAALPLKSTSLEKGEPPTWKEEELVEGKGRLLLFRGCAESAGADQPEIVSLQGWTADQKRQMVAAMKALQAMPSGVDASGTSGRWPPTTESPPIPLQGSLVGLHAVVSTYAPEIQFEVAPSHDFLAPVLLRSTTGAGGAKLLSWQGVPTALGFQATAAAAGKQEGDIVMWTSSEAPHDRGSVPSDLRAAAAARLVQQKVLLPPERTSCAISAGAMAAMQGGAMVTLTAFGETLMVSSATGAPAWQLSLERRSTATIPVGEGLEQLMEGGGGQQEPAKRGGFNPLRLF